MMVIYKSITIKHPHACIVIKNKKVVLLYYCIAIMLIEAGHSFRYPLETNADTVSEVLRYCPETDFLFLAGVSSTC